METLFTVDSARVRLTWSGPRPAPPAVAPMAVTVLAAEDLRVTTAGGSHAIALEEETTYLVLVEGRDDQAVVLEHRDPVVTSGLASANEGRVLHGRIRVGSQAGRIRFDVRSGSTTLFRLEMDVLPTKLNGAEVSAMRSEVEAAAAGLAVAALRPTTVAVERGGEVPSVPVWLAALGQSVERLAEAVREIDRRPVLDAARSVSGQRPGRIRRPSAETWRAARRRGLAGPTLPARPAHLSSDTPAHRWLAARLGVVAHRLRVLLRHEGARRSSARRERVARDLRALLAEVDSLRKGTLMETVGARAPSVPPLVLRRHPVYAAAYDALRQLDRGIDLRSGSLDVATQDLAVLFETWVALAVVRVFADVLGAEPPARPFGVDAVGTDVRLRRGRSHGVRLQGRGMDVEIVNNPRFPAPPALLTQRPDLLVTIRHGGTTRRVVLDAKYRRDDSAAYRRRHGAAGPPEDALGTLHRYRDAIVEGPPVEIAAALFPGTADDAFFRSRLWTSLGSLGVGAIPFRPGDLGALTRFVADLTE
ncbi:DUF2357 domain-containing protein [Rubrivirga marina]|uniref:DUF2357 domain-containing protein n=1 Tax=Rubrivirga marina TaxID=1196024 RepID=A0A271IYK8_9BACT|nr:DUF2357 domain-containing protein [Rubrivirga marina]PAP76167.1 hypothetical protein BSZ37_06755 [Rubrivirga marina]